MHSMPWGIKFIPRNSKGICRVFNVYDIVLTTVVYRVHMIIVDEYVVNAACHVVIILRGDLHIERVSYI